MYHPYFRGKQFELIAIRSLAPLLAERGFVPIIEPVRDNLGGLRRTLEILGDAGAAGIIIVNPHHGQLARDGSPISNLLQTNFLEQLGLTAGILLKSTTTADQAMRLAQTHDTHPVAFIHDGFMEPGRLADLLSNVGLDAQHVFAEAASSRGYRDRFVGSNRTLIRDGFRRRKNREHPVREFFSDLHVTYRAENVDGFGDFLTVGDDFSEGGGPAYAVAIHITWINPEEGNSMFISHFLSDRRDDPDDTPGKFLEALRHLMRAVDAPGSPIYRTVAIEEFRNLLRDRNYPGLGKVKELSMRHHVETLAQFL